MDQIPDASGNIQMKTTIVCELGLNFLGDIACARRMIDILADQGATHVTLQAIGDIHSLSRSAEAVEWLRKYCLPIQECIDGVISYAIQKGLHVGAAVSDPDDIDILVMAGVEFFKLISGDLTYGQLIQKASATGLPVYLSTGASKMEEIARAVKIAKQAGSQPDIRLIHTVLIVPTPAELLNLRNIQMLARQFNIPIAYGQHSNIPEAPTIAVAMGAEALFVYVAEIPDPTLPDGPHAIACNSVGTLLKKIQLTESLLGNQDRVLSSKEQGLRTAVRRSVVAKSHIPQGSVIRKEDLTFKRPWTGVAPWDADCLIGRNAEREFEFDQDVAFEQPGTEE